MKNEVKLEDIVSLAKRRGFIHQGSDVYGGLSGTWDYGPLGVALKRNIMNLWWQMFVDERDDMYGVDAAILMNQKVWQASGHVDTFSDPLIACKKCNSRYRADHLIKDNLDKAWDYRNEIGELDEVLDAKLVTATPDDPKDIIISEFLGDSPQLDVVSFLNDKVSCAKCGNKSWSEPKQFNMMFKTVVGPVMLDPQVFTHPGESHLEIKEHNYQYSVDWSTPNPEVKIDPNDEVAYSTSYLRPETAQGIFTNYKNVVDSFYPDLPFGIAQQGKAFRNEISPRDFVFRSREFEQMEVEYFVHPEKWEQAFEQWRKDIEVFLDKLGLPRDMVEEVEVPENDRAHYSKRTIDYEFAFPHGKDELLGLAYRTDFDLGNIQRASGKNMEYRVKGSDEQFVPHVIEPSFGVERALMAVLTSAYREDEQNGEKRVFLALPEHLAPVLYAVSPLLKNKPELVEKAREVYKMLSAKHPGRGMWDDNGNIGKRYRRQDEIGTPHCVVIDFQTLEDGTVTVRNRDTTEQNRKHISEI